MEIVPNPRVTDRTCYDVLVISTYTPRVYIFWITNIMNFLSFIVKREGRKRFYRSLLVPPSTGDGW